MTPKEKHLITFQNISIMAHADGEFREEEIRLLAEMARGMGLSQDEFGEIIENVDKLDFIVPEDEEECEHELRMVVLTMITDGEIDPREYKSLLRFANQMNISKEYVDKVIDFYLHKQKERLQNLAVFQNLYLVAIADGEIDDKEEALLLEAAETLGMMQSDLDYVYENAANLELIIPEDEDEMEQSLRNLIYMMIIDGDIDDREYKICLSFAESIGYGEEKIGMIINEYEEQKQKEQEEREIILQANIDVYLDLYNDLKKVPKAPTEIIDLVEEMAVSQRWDTLIGPDESHDVAFYSLMWLLYTRIVGMNHDMLVMLPLHLDLARKKNHLGDLHKFMLEAEQRHGRTYIKLPEKKLPEIKAELKEFFDKLKL
ncbi:MAG: TerB family tellurite resistance protein [Bacteroidota bacterium]